MRSLFLKIFLWFWLAMATVVVTISAIVFVTQQQRFREREGMRDLNNLNNGPPSRPEDRVTRQALAVHLQSAAYLLQKEGVPGLQAYLQKLETNNQLRTYCFDEQGNDVLRLPLSQGQNSELDVSRLKLLANRAAQTSRLETINSGPYLLAAQKFSSASAPALQWVLAAAWNSQFDGSHRGRGRNNGPDGGPHGGPHGGPPFGMPNNRRRPPFGGPFGFMWDVLFGEPSTAIQAVRLLVILSMTGLVCYGLVRHLTTPIFQLRAATRRLAAGDLSARVEPELGKRRDELGVLGRDFDQMAERLEDLVGAQNRLIADISHELRSPLARVNVAVELVRTVSGPEAEEDLNRIALETERLNAMIGQLLTLSRLESGEPLANDASVNLAQLIESIAADADFEARSRQRRVRIVQSADCQTRGSETLLRSAVENIVRNAVRYTPENTSVEISLEKVEDSALIRVRDYGPGVPEAALPHLFQPFYRIADARERSSGGTGLGLSIADRAVRFHGGTLEASNVPNTTNSEDNEADGSAGLQLIIRLPLD